MHFVGFLLRKSVEVRVPKKVVPFSFLISSKKCGQTASLCQGGKGGLMFLESNRQGSGSASADTLRLLSHSGKCWVSLGRKGCHWD